MSAKLPYTNCFHKLINDEYCENCGAMYYQGEYLIKRGLEDAAVYDGLFSQSNLPEDVPLDTSRPFDCFCTLVEPQESPFGQRVPRLFGRRPRALGAVCEEEDR